MSKFGIAFLLLALRINKHIKGYVDFYFGPKKLSKIVDKESIISPNKLLTDCINLQEKLYIQGFNKVREKYLEKMLIAMRTSIEILNGVEIPFKTEFLRQFDVTLQPVDESKLENIKEEINEAYTGSGSLEERMAKLRVQRKVPEAKVFELFQKAVNITQKRTQELFVDLLPKKEQIILQLVKNNNKEVKWSFYNWYLGHFRSRIELNPNYSMFWSLFLSAAAHEGYPGHHTEFIIKEQRLWREFNQFEHSLLLIHSPKLIISEGIADLGVNMLFDYREQAEISLREFCLNSLKEDSIEVIIAQNKVRTKLNLFLHNFTYHALFDEWSEEDLIRYGTNFEIYSKENISNQLKMIYSSLFSKNAFMYNIGTNIILHKYGKFPSINNFRDLLVNPILPSDLV